MAPKPGDATRAILINADLPLSGPDAIHTLMQAIFRRTNLGEDLEALGAQLLEQCDALTSHASFATALKRLLEARLQSDPNNARSRQHLSEVEAHEQMTANNSVIYMPIGRENPNAVMWPELKPNGRGRHIHDELPFARRLRLLSRSTPIGTMGTCFTNELAHRLQSRGYRYVVTEDNLNPCKPLHDSSAKWGVLFTTANFRQLIEVAFGERTLPKLLWEQRTKDGPIYRDPFKEEIDFASIEQFEAEHASHLAAAREALLEAKVFMLSLEQNEVWFLKSDGSVLSRNPWFLSPSLVDHRTMTVEENVRELQAMLDLWRRYNPDLQLIVSVSPMPLLLTAHADDMHVATATGHAKAVLRVAAEQFAGNNPGVYYFPAFETATYCVKAPWEADARHLTPETFEKILDLFEEMFLDAQNSPTGNLPPQTPPVIQPTAPQKTSRTEAASRPEIVFGPRTEGMVIAGNSHVTLFKGSRYVAAPDEKVGVHWVGALEIENFFHQHPAAQKVRRLFESESGWKLLLIGNHDLFWILSAARRASLEAALDHMLGRYHQVFAELSRLGRFAWLVGVPQVENLPVPGYSPAEVMAVANEFIGRLSRWCQEHAIPVINPLSKVMDASGLPRAELLMPDRLHLKPEAAPLYFDAISELTGENLELEPPEGTAFEPKTEPESFGALVVGELDLPRIHRPTLSAAELENRLLAFIHERLAEKGQDVILEPESDFVANGLMDSLDLVETYGYAMDLLGNGLPFDLNLRELGTVRKLSEFLGPHGQSQGPGLAQDDFFVSLDGDFMAPDQQAALLAAEARIEAMGDVRYRQLQDVVQTVTEGNLRYGVMWFWMALAEHGLGHVSRALELLDTASHPTMAFPFTDPRVDYYRERWNLERPSAVASLPDRRGFNLMLAETDPRRLEQGIRSYLEAFSSEDDVALHILAGGDVETAETLVIHTLEALGRDPDHIPDICLLPYPRSDQELPAFLRAADLVIGSPELAERCRPIGLEVLLDPTAKQLAAPRDKDYLVTAIVSTYNSERFIRGRLDDLVAQTLYAAGRLEILVIDSASPQNEQAIVKEYQERCPHIRYLRTPERETVYAAWNRGVELAKGRYVINANTDDRFAPDALAIMAAELDADARLDAVYGDWVVTQTENDRFDSTHPKFRFYYPGFIAPLFFYFQITTHAALMRRDVFDRIGMYDGGLKVYGDRDLMMRFAAHGLRAKHLPVVVGLYLDSPTSVEHANHSAETEFAAIRNRYLEPAQLYRLFGEAPTSDPRHLAHLYAVAGSYGKDYYHWDGVPCSDLAFAVRCFEEALGLDPFNPIALNNLGILLALNERRDDACALFQRALYFDETGAIRHNMDQARTARRLGDFTWLSPETPAVRQRYQILLTGDLATLKAGIACYVEACSEEEPVTLTVLATSEAETLVAELPQLLAESGYSPEKVADISIRQGPQRLEEWPAHLMAADLVLAPVAEATRARSLGVPAFSAPSVASLQEAVRTFGDLDWTSPAVKLEASARERWLTSFEGDWRPALEAYLAAKAATPERDLVLVIDAPEPEAAAAEITAHLEAKGLVPEACPDIVLTSEAAAVSLFRAATTWVDTGSTYHRAIAEALGLALLRPGQPEDEQSDPLVSVVVPCYNYGRYLAEAVESVLDQSLRDLEIVIVNDGSSDDTSNIAARLLAAHPTRRIRLLEQPNSGHPSIARNNGVQLARGRYVLCLDADDKINHDFLELCVFALEVRPDVSIAYPDVQKYGAINKRETHLPYDFATLTRFNYITATSVFRRQAWADVGGFPSQVGYEDWDFWITCGEHGHVGVYLPEAISWYRIHSEGTYSKDRPKDQSIKAQIVLRHPTLYTREQQEWARGVLAGDPEALAIDGGLGIVPTLAPSALTRRVPNAAAGLDEQSLHILFTMYGWAEEGGGTILPRQIAKALVKRGHRVSVLYTPSQTRPDKPTYHVEESEEDGVRLFAIYNRPAIFYDLENPEREANDPTMSRLVAALVAELKADIVHYHSLLTFSTGIAAEIKHARVPSVYTSHNYWPLCPRMYLFQNDLTLCGGPSPDGSKCAICLGRADKIDDYANRFEHGRLMLNRWVDRHLAVSHRVREIYIQNGHEASRIQVLQQQPETVDWLWEMTGSSRHVETSIDRPLKVGFIGSLLPQKGVHVLVQALQSFERNQVECHLFGSGPKAYEDTLRQLDTHGLVQFHGRYETDQLPALLRQVDVVVVPSIWEDCAPLVVAEALAARCPVIGSRIGGIPDFINEGQTGLLVDPRNAPSLASALYQFVREPGLLGRMQRNIPAPHGFGAYLDDLLRHYQEVIANQRLHVVWEGSQFVHHSLALINREVCQRLVESGIDLSLIPFEPDDFGPGEDQRLQALAERIQAPLEGAADVHVRHQWPPRLDPPADGCWVMIQPWEFGGIPQAWVAPMRDLVDEIWVPSRHVQEGYVRSGIPADKVVVIPNGVDSSRLHPEALPYPLKTKKRFKFLFVGGTILRKGIDILLEVYTSTFTADDDVCLVIKDMGGKSFYSGKTAQESIADLQAIPGAPEIEYIDRMLSDEEVVGLYTACDCLVHPYRGEGFGLPIAEAMACGMPVIVTGYGACLDFCDSQSAYLIPAEEVPVESRGMPSSSVGYWWAEPDPAELARLMQHVVAHPAEAKAIGHRARQRIGTDFTWEQMADRIKDRMRDLAMRRPVRLTVPDSFRPGVAPRPIEGRRSHAFFHHPQWHTPDWRKVLIGFAEAFQATDDVCMVLWLDPAQRVSEEEAGELILAALMEAGLDPEQVADVLLVADGLDLEGLAGLYAAADCVVPHGDPEQADRARRLGISVLTGLEPKDWQAMRAVAPTHVWQGR